MDLCVRSNDFKYTLVDGCIKDCSSKERWIFSLKKLFLFWSLAGVSVFIPLAHFILVPTFLLAGAVSFILHFNKTHIVRDLSFNCPKCQQKNSYAKKIFLFRDEMRFYCTTCAEQLVVASTAPNN